MKWQRGKRTVVILGVSRNFGSELKKYDSFLSTKARPIGSADGSSNRSSQSSVTATPTGGNTSIGPNHLSTGEAISCRCAEFLARGIHAHPCAPVIDPQQSCTGRVVAGGRPPVWLGVSARDNGAEHLCESCEYQPNNRVRLLSVEQNDSNGCTNRSRSAKCIVFIGRVNREMPNGLVTAVCRTKTCKLICKSSVFVNGRMRIKGSSSRFCKILNQSKCAKSR